MLRRLRQSLKRPYVRMSFLLVFCIVVISTVLLSISIVGKIYRYNTGDIAREDIRVNHDINYQIDLDTRRKRERASEKTHLVFDKDQAVLVDRLAMVDTFFRHVRDVLEENPPIGTEDRTFQLISLKSRIPRHMPYGDRILLGILRDVNPERLRGVVNKILVYIFDRGILREPYQNPLNVRNTEATIRAISSMGESSEFPANLDELVTLDEIRKDLNKKTYAIAPFLPQEQLHAVRDMVDVSLAPNLSFNIEETQRRIDEAVKSVEPVMGMLKKGHTIVRRGEPVTSESFEKIQIINRDTQSRNVYYVLGIFILQFLMVVIFTYLILFFYERIISENKSPLIAFSLVVIFIIYSFLLSRIDNIMDSRMIFALFLPISFVTMMIAILNNVHISIVAGIYMVFWSYVISGESTATLITAFSSALLGAFLAVDVERRSAFLRTGLVIGAVNVLIVISLGLVEGFSFGETLQNTQVALGNGIINAMLVLGFLPIYETTFGVTTNFKLLELSDLNAPLFKKMIIKAPGTYNHSLMVANMAEAACKEIRANYLLSRVGGYYHDIGKIPDSGMYIENKITDKRAKSMTPREYSRLIISHVEKGVEMAEKDGLPESVIAFIREHHGESTMTYFYHQALELADASETEKDIDKSHFQYPGPRPSSPETAIVMLADAIEAASRSIQEPTQQKLEGLVKKIVYNKLNEGELENSNLTMYDLNRVQRAFLRILNGIYHTRIEYPSKGDVEDMEDRVMGRDDEEDEY